MMPNHHITKPVYIGEIQARRPVQHRLADARHGASRRNGRPIWRARSDLIADWRKPMSCGNFNVKTGKCGG